MISNIWMHWKTSLAGLLIAAVTIAGVLSQQGVTLGNAGTGTMVALIAAIATALLGLLAKDPVVATTVAPGSNQAKLGAWALIALLVMGTMFTGCNGVTVAQDIVNWTPSLQSAVATVDTTIAVLAPADAPIFAAATIGFDAASNLLVAQAKAYLANPSASVLAQLQTQIVTFQQQVNTSLLAAAKIANVASQQHALAAIDGVATIVTALLALITQISTKAAVAQMAQASTIKLARIEPLVNFTDAATLMADHYQRPVCIAALDVTIASARLQTQGF